MARGNAHQKKRDRRPRNIRSQRADDQTHVSRIRKETTLYRVPEEVFQNPLFSRVLDEIGNLEYRVLMGKEDGRNCLYVCAIVRNQMAIHQLSCGNGKISLRSCF